MNQGHRCSRKITNREAAKSQLEGVQQCSGRWGGAGKQKVGRQEEESSGVRRLID